MHSLGARKPFNKWTEAALRDYCVHGLIEQDAHYRLACPPELEAAIYPKSATADITDQLGSIAMPVTVVRAAPADLTSTVNDFSKSPTWPDLANQLPQGRDVYLPEYSHFMPLENPALAATIIREPFNP